MLMFQDVLEACINVLSTDRSTDRNKIIHSQALHLHEVPFLLGLSLYVALKHSSDPYLNANISSVQTVLFIHLEAPYRRT